MQYAGGSVMAVFGALETREDDTERAECVMLNKGPHIVDAMRTLGGILHRMQAHQSKKRPLLRALKARDLPAPAGAAAAAEVVG